MSAAAQAFVRARHGAVLLAVTGCQPLGVNPAHPKSSRPIRQIRTVSAYRSIVAQARAQLCDLVSSGGASPHHQPCYCLGQSHILALRLEDCVYEERFLTFRRLPSVWQLRGFEFTFRHSDSEGRHYAVSRVHAKLIYALQNQFGEAHGIVEARIITSRFVRLTIAGDGHEFRLRARLEGGADLFAETVRLSPDRLGPYRELETALREALGAREHQSAVKVLTAFASQAGMEAGGYSLVDDILRSILAARSHAELKSRIETHLARLWDAPVVSREVRRELDGRLADPALRAAVTTEQAADLAMLDMPLEEVEALEQLEGAIRGGRTGAAAMPA